MDNSNVPPQPRTLRHLVQRLDDLILNLRVAHRAFERATVLSRNIRAPNPARDTGELDGVGDDKRDEVRLQRVAVHVQLRDNGGRTVERLDALERDVLALRELHDILHAVDDPETATLVELGDVAGVLPALLVDGGFGVLGICCVRVETRLS